MKRVMCFIMIPLVMASCETDPVTEVSDQCCIHAHVTDTVGDYFIAVANAFTPNGDGVNDAFRITDLSFADDVHGNVHDTAVSSYSMEISKDGSVTYSQSGTTDIYDLEWNGREPNGDQSFGVYNYSFTITFNNGYIISKSGKVCSLNDQDIDCTSAINLSNCVFPSEYIQSERRFDTLISFEDLCP